MPDGSPLVSIGLPVRNGAHRIRPVVESVLRQDHSRLELVISDNASTDGTERLCRELAAADPRVRYHRQETNVGLLNNFITAVRLARGEFFRWIGDGDTLEPAYVSGCLAAFRADPGRILVTTQIGYRGPDGVERTAPYHGTGLAAPDRVVRFREILRLLNQSYLVIDPLYGMLRRNAVADLSRVNMYCEDQVLAIRLALAGPWGHVPEVLARRGWEPEQPAQVARKLGVPRWQPRLATWLLCRDVLRHLADSGLDARQRRQARAALARFYLVRQQRIAARRGRKLARLAGRVAVPLRGRPVPAPVLSRPDPAPVPDRSPGRPEPGAG